MNGIVYVEPEEGNLIGSLLMEAGANLTFDLPDVADADELLEVQRSKRIDRGHDD